MLAVRVGLVVPEYRTAEGIGGVATVADFLLEAFDPGWEVSIVSVRMSRRAPESRALLRPRTWFSRLRARERGGVTYAGAHLAESEVVRFSPRRVVDRALAGVDVVVVVSGSPAFANVVRRVPAPVLLQVATFVGVERASVLADSRGLRGRLLAASTRALGRMERAAVRGPDLVLVENEWMHGQCRALGARRVVLCPPGVDTEVFVPPASVPVVGELVCVARLGDRRKDFGTLVRAYARARELGVSRRLVVAGRGSLPADVTTLIAALGLNEHVEVRHDLSRDALVALLQSAHLYVMSSTEEGLGLTLVEAMACGTPVVATATEGAKAVVGDSMAGELVPIADVEALGAALARWDGWETGTRRMRGEAARARAERHFSLHVSGARFRELIEETASGSA